MTSYPFPSRRLDSALGRLGCEVLEVRCTRASASWESHAAASETLRAIDAKLGERGITLVVCGLVPEVRAELDRAGLTELLGVDHVFEAPDEVISADRR
jgi:hypothetical protein